MKRPIALAGLLFISSITAFSQEETEIIVKTPMPPNKRGKPQPPAESVCWLPKDCKYVRGVVVAHPMIKDLAIEPRFRKVAAEEGLGTLLMKGFTWDVKKNWEALDDVLNQWAEQSGHPELRGAPVFVSGLSASVLMARLLVYERPERCFGILHVAGGNMQEQYPKDKTLSGVPFMAANGEYESCGPAGGIRPHLGFDTQWYLMGEQMLERRREDPNHLMCMVVVPVKGHTAWSKQLGELFIRKCAKYRLPKEKRDGSTPAKCVDINFKDGWLTHRNVKYPEHPPAAWADYKGDKKEAFWHLDKEMALAVRQYHTDGKRSGQDHSLFRPLGLFDKLWPLPQHMDIPFKGHSQKDYEAAIKKWVTSKTQGVKPVALKSLAQGIAMGLAKGEDGNVSEEVCRKMCLKVCYAYNDAYRPVEQAIDKAQLPNELKDRLRAYYAEQLLVLWPHGKATPRLSVRETQALVAGLSKKARIPKTVIDKEDDILGKTLETYGKPPDTLDQFIKDLAHKDWKTGWGAVDKIAAIGKPAIPVLVRTMEWAGQPSDMRAAAALGKMGAIAEPALPDLERMGAIGGKSAEPDGLVCVKALEAIALIDPNHKLPITTTPPPKRTRKLLAASYFGTKDDDNFEGAVAGPDGCLYLVGNAGTRLGRFSLFSKPVLFGDAVDEPRCGYGFVLKLSPDASKILACAQFDKGILHATGIAVSDGGVYVGGFASDGLETLLEDRKGLITEYPLRPEQQLIRDGEVMEANGKPGADDPLANRPWLGRLGAPCVLRLTSDLDSIINGTYLEGWQQVHDKKRICGRLKGRFPEFFWQPINICPTKSGDIIVSHDGGYFRLLTYGDRQQAEKAQDTEEGRAKARERFCFYDTADYVSRLSGDLSERRWRTDILTPPTDPAVAGPLKNGWPLTHFGNPRVHRMRMDPGGNVWVAGWSATLTSKEPWWSPFLWRLEPETGKPTKRFYEYDPMSGGGNRMGGTVADTAVLSVAVEDDGDLLTCLISDGGNTWMSRGPRGNEGEKMKGPIIGPGLGGSPAHFWGQAHRVDGKTFDGLGGCRSGPWAWQTDAAGLADEHFLALGRWNHKLPWSKDAWWTESEIDNPNAFLRVVAPDYNTVFWTALPGVRPYELTPLGDDRYIVTGFARDGVALLKDSLSKPRGGEDAWFAIVEWSAE